jgi:hypothetical protein
MFRSSAFRIAGVLLFAAHATAFAQTAQTRPAGQKPQPPAAQTPPPANQTPFEFDNSPAVSTPRPPLGQLVNVKLDITITDQRSNGAPASKTVSMLLSDRNPGRIRTSGDVRVGNAYRPITLNVDATPEVLRDGRIRVSCNVEYRAQLGQGNQEENQPTTVSEMFNVILTDGKQTVVSQSADPASDRKVQLELKAGILK